MRIIDSDALNKVFEEANQSERKRSHLLFHKSHQDKVQRLLIALVAGSYVEPHFHELDHQWEMFIVTEGELRITYYNTQGEVLDQFIAGPKHGVVVVEFHPGDIHSVECLSARAVMLEIKEGPFDPKYAKAFPHWN